MEPRTVEVLVADDDAAMLAACRSVLRRLFGDALRLHEARSPEQALDLLREVEPHLVLSDYCFPSPMSGIDLLAAVARERPGAMRVLMTGFPTAEVVVEAANRAHVHGFLAKPTRVDVLEADLAKLIGRRN